MEALHNQLASSSSSSAIYSICGNKPRGLTRNGRAQPILNVPRVHRELRIGARQRLAVRASLLDAATIDQLGLSESEIRNPTVSSSYRSSELSKPNQTVLEAQARVCTGPAQTRPLGEDQALKVLDTILRSGNLLS